MTLPAATLRRLEVMQLRVRLERVGADSFDAACGADPSRLYRQSDIHTRVLFVLALVGPDRQADAHRAVRLARHVYARTSDVLHGRINGMFLPTAVLEEWESVVKQVEALMLEAESWP